MAIHFETILITSVIASATSVIPSAIKLFSTTQSWNIVRASPAEAAKSRTLIPRFAITCFSTRNARPTPPLTTIRIRSKTLKSPWKVVVIFLPVSPVKSSFSLNFSTAASALYRPFETMLVGNTFFQALRAASMVFCRALIECSIVLNKSSRPLGLLKLSINSETEVPEYLA